MAETGPDRGGRRDTSLKRAATYWERCQCSCYLPNKKLWYPVAPRLHQYEHEVLQRSQLIDRNYTCQPTWPQLPKSTASCSAAMRTTSTSASPSVQRMASARLRATRWLQQENRDTSLIFKLTGTNRSAGSGPAEGVDYLTVSLCHHCLCTFGQIEEDLWHRLLILRPMETLRRRRKEDWAKTDEERHMGPHLPSTCSSSTESKSSEKRISTEKKTSTVFPVSYYWSWYLPAMFVHLILTTRPKPRDVNIERLINSYRYQHCLYSANDYEMRYVSSSQSKL